MAECPRCNDEGTVPCRDCELSPGVHGNECVTCEGEGEVECPNCEVVE